MVIWVQLDCGVHLASSMSEQPFYVNLKLSSLSFWPFCESSTLGIQVVVDILSICPSSCPLNVSVCLPANQDVL